MTKNKENIKGSPTINMNNPNKIDREAITQSQNKQNPFLTDN